MGQCKYRYNPSEQYQRAKPGMAPETECGARTYPAIDEPEVIAIPRGDGTTEFRHSGYYLPRGYDDPYCPTHGGTEEPPPPPVTTVQLQEAYENYLALAERYGDAVPAVIPNPLQIAMGQKVGNEQQQQQQ